MISSNNSLLQTKFFSEKQAAKFLEKMEIRKNLQIRWQWQFWPLLGPWHFQDKF